MKNKKLLIGIVSGLALIIIAVVIGLLLDGEKKEEATKPKETKKLNEVRTFEGYEFTDATVQEENSKYAFIANVTAKEQKDTFTRVIITYYDENNKELGAAICALPRANVGEMKSFGCTTDNKEILKAVDYKVVKTDKEIGE